IGILEYLYYHRAFMDSFLLLFRIKESVKGSGYLVSSLFTNSNPYGVFNALFIVTTMSIWLSHRNILNKYLFVIGLVFGSIGVFFSGSRNAMVILIIGLTILVVYSLKRNRAMKWMGVCLLILVCIFLFSARYNRYFSNKLGQVIPAIAKLHDDKAVCPGDFKINRNFSGLTDRLDIWRTGLQRFREKPVFGWGISASRYWLGFSVPYSMHNFYLEILVTNGIVGFALIMALIAIWLSRLRAGWCWAPAIVLLVSGMFDTFFDLCSAWLVFVAWIVAVTTKDIIFSDKARDSEFDAS
ncbi:MAG: O-antigen ligase family protein, partial [Thermodesulfobacteriota bacterium]|nr:O-antigen ligase family protein [Thermodesulfobacteriota bacterium]